MKYLKYIVFLLFLLEMGICSFGNTRLIKNLDIHDVWTDNYNASHWIELGNLHAGAQMYGDTLLDIIKMPAELYGADWIQTSYKSKFFDKSVIASFQLSADAEVYIAHSTGIKEKPAWLNSYTKTGKFIVNSENQVFELFKKSFQKGDSVVLGANGSNEQSMFIVIVNPTNAFPSMVKPEGRVFDVLNYGAKGDNKTNNTLAIQSTIDACSANGGGSVYLHDGIFISGTLELKDNVTLFVAEGALLRASALHADFPAKICSLQSFRSNENFQFIYADRKKNVAIKGGGIIDGYALREGYPWGGRNNEYERPRLIRMVECKNVKVQDISLIRSANWTQYYEGCENLSFENVRVRCYTGVNNEDGIDISGCKNVEISKFYSISGDDGICIKAMSMKPTKNIYIHDCIGRYNNCHAVKIGTETHGIVKNMLVKNVTSFTRYGIAIEAVDGADVKNITYDGITLTDCSTPLFIRLGNRGRIFKGGPTKAPISHMKNITVRNITNNDIHYVLAKGGPGVGSAIGGIPERKIENLLIENCNLKYYGSIMDTSYIYRNPPENVDKYPEFNIYGICPAYGLYVRHVKNLNCKNVNITCKNEDVRPAVVLDDVEKYKINNLNCQKFSKTKPGIIWDKVKGTVLNIKN
ncbi:MAG: glycosyl hydrolase family 28 protein [Bacteroidota bacterium]|nr:glycosyl hydrolase family 28 protein [Bacteroidota bacterium]